MPPTTHQGPAGQPSAINDTYKHLAGKVKLGGLTIWQWVQLIACALLTFGLQSLLPFSGTWNLSIALTIAGLPAVAAFAAMSTDFDVPAYVRAFVGWARRRNRRRLPGHNPTVELQGYLIEGSVQERGQRPQAATVRPPQPAARELEGLWS